MRIQCQSCQAKYTMADEKVGKKVFELRCKQCSAMIRIDGSIAPRDPSDTTKAFDYAGGSNEQWSVNVADGDRRTMTSAEIAREYAAGVVDDDTYCWKEGMDDWLPICEIEELYGLAKAPAARTPEPSEAPPSTAARRDGGRGRGADLFGNAAKAGSEEEEVAKKAESSPEPSAEPSPKATPAPAAEPKATETPKLTGARSEDSVLFSASSVKSETTSTSTDGAAKKLAPLQLSSLPSSSPSKSASSASSTGAALQNSGLIDIRSLAVDKDADESGKKDSGASVDDIMNLSGGGAFGSALAAPVLGLPATDASSIAPAPGTKPNKSLVPAILGGAALIAVAIVSAVVLSRPPAAQPTSTGPTVTATTTTGGGTAPTGSVGGAEPTTTTGTSVPPAPGTGTASAKVASVGPSDKNARPVVAAAGGSAASAAGEAKPEETAPPASATAATPAPAPTPDKPPDLASALANAAGKPDEKPADNSAAAGSGAPFDRGAAAASLGGIDIQPCKKPDGPTGPGHVNVTFAPDGSVASAIVDQGPFPGTPVGGCIAGKYRGARVPAFSGAPVRVGKSFTMN